MISLNEIFAGTRWHVINKEKKDILFCEANGNFAPFMGTLALPQETWETNFGYKFVCILPSHLTWDEYVEDYHNKELANFKKLSLNAMCEQLRKIYVDCESNIQNFNSDKKFSKFREILNQAIGIRHGKGNRVATKNDCIDAFKEYQDFIK